MDRIEAMEAFVRLVELGNFSKVAKELRIKQSTVSKWMAKLEKQLHVQLIERTSRSVRITDAGQLFYHHSREILATFEDTQAQLQKVSTELRGRLKVSVPVVFGRLFITPYISAFMHLHPGLELELVFNDSYVRMLEEGFDVAIRVGIPEDSSLRCTTLARTPRRVVASPDYLERYGIPIAPLMLEEHCCLLHTGVRTRVVWAFSEGERTIKASVSGRIAANNSEALLTMAREGLGVSLLASWLVDDDLRSGRLVPILEKYTLPSAPVQALTLATKYTHPRVRVFLDWLKGTFSKIEALQGIVREESSEL